MESLLQQGDFVPKQGQDKAFSHLVRTVSFQLVDQLLYVHPERPRVGGVVVAHPGVLFEGGPHLQAELVLVRTAREAK